MLTHHFQDPNGESILGTGPGGVIINGKYITKRGLMDLDDSYTSER